MSCRGHHSFAAGAKCCIWCQRQALTFIPAQLAVLAVATIAVLKFGVVHVADVMRVADKGYAPVHATALRLRAALESLNAISRIRPHATLESGTAGTEPKTHLLRLENCHIGDDKGLFPNDLFSTPAPPAASRILGRSIVLRAVVEEANTDRMRGVTLEVIEIGIKPNPARPCVKVRSAATSPHLLFRVRGANKVAGSRPKANTV
mmetsp:Transcript_24965/g.57905  ORF Transcript_24965/g.57905 Transcript_24965/m.57905 type:complete len:205 (+) Transcript_24965:303-917(+)